MNQFFQHLFFFYHGDEYLYNGFTSVNIDNFVMNGLLLEELDAGTFRDILYSEESGLRVLKQQEVDGYLVNAPVLNRQ